MELGEATKICKALGDDNRLRIVQMLTQGEMCACKIQDEFNMTQPAMSHHMKTLCDVGLVKRRKEGKWCHYSIDCAKFREFKGFITDITCSGNKDEQ